MERAQLVGLPEVVVLLGDRRISESHRGLFECIDALRAVNATQTYNILKHGECLTPGQGSGSSDGAARLDERHARAEAGRKHGRQLCKVAH